MIQTYYFYSSSQAYVDMWLKIKIQCSGYPAGCDTDAEKDNYIKKFEDLEGIKLDKHAICHNPSLRMIAKLFLNR